MPKKSLHTYLQGVVFSALCAGCVLPWNAYTPGSRRNIHEETVLMILPGQTTKEEIFLALGAPDEVSPDGSQSVYSWEKIKALIAIAQYAPPGEVIQKSSLLITFDERGVVAQREVQKNFSVPW